MQHLSKKTQFTVSPGSAAALIRCGWKIKFILIARGCRLYLAGRPSRWALAHILDVIYVAPYKPDKCKILLVFIIYRNNFSHYYLFWGVKNLRLVMCRRSQLRDQGERSSPIYSEMKISYLLE